MNGTIGPPNPPAPEPQVLRTARGTIAYHPTPGRLPGVTFLGGFMSDMTGTKAVALEEKCRGEGRAYLRFDYTGHGRSSGKFVDGTIGGWAEDAVAVLDALTSGPQVLVGSSMGGWIMLLAALARPERVAGMVGIAAAPDFTEELIAKWTNEEQRAALARDGICYLPDDEGTPHYPITRALIEDGNRHLLLGSAIAIHCPVALVHGMRDVEVPYETSLRLARALAAKDVSVTFVKDGGHRMSDPPHLDDVFAALERILAKVS